MTDHDLAVWALVLNAIAATITIFAAAVGYSQYRLATKQLVKLRYIRHSTEYATGATIGDEKMVIDLLSYGATIWDMQVMIRFFIPATFDKHGKQVHSASQRFFSFEPLTPISPLSSGQAMKFIMSRPENFRSPLGDQAPEVFLRTLPPRLVSIVVYSGKGRHPIARFRSSEVRYQIYTYFKVYRREMTSIWARLNSRLFMFTFSPKGHQFRLAVERFMPGLYDQTKARLQKFIDGRDSMERD